MFENIRQLYALLNFREKRSFIVLVLVMLVEAMLEMLAIGLIPVFITILAYPQQIEQHAFLHTLATSVGIAGRGRETLVVWGSIVLLGFFVTKAVYGVFAVYWKARFAQNRSLKLSVRLFNAYLRAPYAFHLGHNSSELFRNVNNECAGLAGRILLPLLELITQSTILLAVSLAVTLIVPPLAIGWLVLFLILGFGGTLLLQRQRKQLGLEAQQQRGKVVRAINEGLGGVKEIMLMRRSDFFTDRLATALARVLTIQRMHQLLQRTIPSLVETLGVLGLLGITVMLILDATPPPEMVATLSVFAVAMARMKGSLRIVLTAYSELRHNSPSLAVVYQGLSTLEPLMAERQDNDPTQPALRFAREISLDHATYTYPEGVRPAVDDVSFTIRRGEAVGFVGTTGSGKSTLFDLIMGVATPQGGRVMVDGIDIHTALAGWHAHLGFVPQSIYLLDASVRENIALGLTPAATDERRVLQAVRAAALEAFVDKLPQGLDTPVGEAGVRLSGGERQRIAIARALYLNPDVLLMDEATSALDNTTEAAVVEAVDALKGDRTVLIVAHRLSTVRRCDRIVFLKNGRVDAIGSYDELTASHADFQRMADV